MQQPGGKQLVNLVDGGARPFDGTGVGPGTDEWGDGSSGGAVLGNHPRSCRPKREGEFLVVTADGKGVPIRKPSGRAPIEAHEGQRGPKPDRKKVAIVGAIYGSTAYPRTPEQVV